MLRFTLLNNQPCWINPDHMVMLEARPDTLIRLSNGEKWLVKESVPQVQAAFMAYKQRIHQEAPPFVPDDAP